MKCAADFRSFARRVLAGRWTVPVIAGLIAALLGGVTASRLNIDLNINIPGLNPGLDSAGQQIFSSGGFWSEALRGFLAGSSTFLTLAALALTVAYFILGSIVGVGYSKFNLNLIARQKEPEIETLFDYFKHWKTTALTRLLRGVYVFLWSLLFVIPGIVASYSYAMTTYILAEHPELTASQAVEQSKAMMTGNRWRLFCLHFSFIGWDILCALTLGIGNLWLRPYKQAAEAAFYRQVSGTAYVQTPRA